MLHLCLPVLLRNLLFCLLQKHHQRTGHYCCGRSTATSSCISCTSCKTTVAVSFSYILYFLQWGVINCNPWKQSCSLFRLCTFTLLPQKKLPIPCQMGMEHFFPFILGAWYCAGTRKGKLSSFAVSWGGGLILRLFCLCVHWSKRELDQIFCSRETASEVKLS